MMKVSGMSVAETARYSIDTGGCETEGPPCV
jgi:hypothetical protein